jgi:hypothetical protein
VSASPQNNGLLVLVVGVGRSGTSLLTGILSQLGLYVPQPEIQANSTNPRGFGEPEWVVHTHRRLLREVGVTPNDARPQAWELTHAVSAETAIRDWLPLQFAHGSVVVVKDPRTIWFLPQWVRAAEAIGIRTGYVTMVRHPAEIVRSAITSYGTWQTEASRTAAFVNITLESERATRGGPRAFIQYENLLADWRTEVRRVGAALGLSTLTGAGDQPEIDAFVDPSLHRNRVRWEDLDVPPRLAEMAEEVAALVQRQTTAESTELAGEFDAARLAYARFYREAEEIAQSSIVAAGAAARGRASLSARRRLAHALPEPVRRWARRTLRGLRSAG